MGKECENKKRAEEMKDKERKLWGLEIKGREGKLWEGEEMLKSVEMRMRRVWEGEEMRSVGRHSGKRDGVLEWRGKEG